MISLSRKEFIALMAALMSLAALSIDTVLPALSLMQDDLGVESKNHVQFIIGILFGGMMIGQIVFGPIADSYGRKTGIFIGLFIFIVGSTISLFSMSFSSMLLGRFLQGFGAASTRIICVAIIRDLYSGREMAQVMSFIMTVFIFIPMVAPGIGEVIITISNWNMIFLFYLIYASITTVWIYKRFDETLALDKRKQFSIQSITEDFFFVFKNRTTMGYTVASGLIFGAFVGYLSSSQQIFQEFFDTGKLFSLYFAISAFSIGLASLFNGFIVKRIGVNLICTIALIGIISSSVLFSVFFDLSNSYNLFFPYMLSTVIIFFCYGLLFGNLNSMTMEPMGDRAGTASSVVGCLSTGISIAIGGIIGQLFDKTLWPLILGFLSMSLLALGLHFFLQLNNRK